MLPNKSRISKLIVAILIGLVTLSIFPYIQTTNANIHPKPKILTPSSGQVTGEVPIHVIAQLADSVDLYLFNSFPEFAENNLCYTIATNLTLTGGELTFLWNSNLVVDHDEYVLLAVSHYSNSTFNDRGDVVVGIETENGKIGEVCESPEPPIDPGGGSEVEPPDDPPIIPPTEESGNSSNGSNKTSQTTETTTSPSVITQSSTQKKASVKKEGDAVVVFDEDIPITLDRFDPDLFLKGTNISVDEIKSVTSDSSQAIYFSGKAPADSLVTLYLFSSPVIVILRTDKEGNWFYEREATFDSGKHTAFATIYDDSVTRRSPVLDFFVATGTKDGQNLILGKGDLQKYLPYITVIAGAITMAVLIILLYRIYSKRKQIKT